MALTTLLAEIKERIAEHKSFYQRNELAVRVQLIDPILDALGWNTRDPNYVRHNEANEEGRIPDYTLLKGGKQVLIVEAKNLSVPIADAKVIKQLSDYCYSQSIKYGVLTNGSQWLLFDAFIVQSDERIIWQCSIEADSTEIVAKNLSNFAFGNIEQLKALLETRKILEAAWNHSFADPTKIAQVLAERLLRDIKSLYTGHTLSQAQVQGFTLLKLTQLNQDVPSVGTYQPEFAAGPITNHPEVKENLATEKAKREKIEVRFPDGSIICDKNVTQTFVQTLRRVGLERIKALNLVYSKTPLVGNTRNPPYNQHDVDGHLVMVNVSTPDKLAILNRINNLLSLNLAIKFRD